MKEMYDHLTLYGFVVYPADGSVGDKSLQAQSSDAVQFWSKRGTRIADSKLTPATEADLHGWKNSFTNVDSVFGNLVIDKIKMEGYPNLALILWQKDFTSGKQAVGVTYSADRGYKVALFVKYKNNEWSDTPFVNDEHISYYYKNFEKYVKSSTREMIISVDAMISKARNQTRPA